MLTIVGKNLNYSSSTAAADTTDYHDDSNKRSALVAGSSEPEYRLVREEYEPTVDDALPGVPCENGVFSGSGTDRAALGCALRCSQVRVLCARARVCAVCVAELRDVCTRTHEVMNPSCFKLSSSPHGRCLLVVVVVVWLCRHRF